MEDLATQNAVSLLTLLNSETHHISLQLTRILHFILLLSLTSSLWAQSNPCAYVLKPSAQAKYDKALDAYEKKQFKEASELLRKLHAQNPKSADICFYLGMSAVAKGDNPGAIKRYFTKLLTLCPDYPNALAHFYMGVVLYSDDKFDEAVTELNRFFEIANQTSVKEYDAVYVEASNYLYWSQFLADAYRNLAPFAPRVMLGVSSRSNEYLPYMTPDEKEMYYVRMISKDKEYTFYEKQFDHHLPQLCISRWKDTSFSEGEVLQEPFNHYDNEGAMTMTADKKQCYYSVMIPDRGYSNCDIYCSRFRNGWWTTSVSAGRTINGDRSWDSQPSITPDGQFLYFASNREGGIGGTDIWRCHRLPNGDWSRAENLGPSVNTDGNEKCPFIHADGHTLYFASDGWQGFGGYDMYFINVNDPYSQRPTNLGLPINTDQDDICFGVAADGVKAYYAGRSSVFPGVGGNDVFMFELYPAARPEPMSFFKGSLRNASGQPLHGWVTVSRPSAEDAIYPVDSVDGSYSVMLSQQEVNVFMAQTPGYMPYIVTATTLQLRQRGNAAVSSVVLHPLQLNAKYPLLISGAKLSDADRRILNAYAAFFLQNPRLSLSVQAPNAIDAKVVADYLLSQKLRPERITFRGGTDVHSFQFVITQL